MAGVLEGLRVLDLGWGIAGPMAGMLLADHGADVTRIEPPAGEPFPTPDGYRVWHRGKRSAVLDLENAGERETFLALAARADVLLESFAPGVTVRLGIDYATLARLNPRLVYCSITAYGRDTADAQRPGYDALVAARTGLQWEARGWYGTPMERIQGQDREQVDFDVPPEVGIGAPRDGPVFTATAAPSVVAAWHAVLGISAALWARRANGRGQWVETSLLQAVICASGSGWQRPRRLDAPGYQFPVAERRQTWGIVRARDGWMCTWVSPVEWFEAAGAGEHLRVPDPAEVRQRVGSMPSVESRLRALARAAPVFARFDVDDWVRVAAESGEISCQPVRTPEQALCDPALIADGAVIEVEDQELGVLRQAGSLYRLHDNPIHVRWAAPRRGEHTEDIRREARELAPEVPIADVPALPGGGPLAGVRVLDFGAAVAGPWSSQLLADLGADVIKIDSRRQEFWLRSHMALCVNRSKRMVGIELKTPEGQDIARGLIAGADVVVHNMRPQAARKLGLDWDNLRTLNPRLVYCQTRGFEDGARSELPGNDQTGNALGGTEWEDGGCENGGRPWFGVTSNGDIGNGYFAAIAIVQALLARERTGHGQCVDSSIVNAALFNNSRVFTTPEGQRFPRATLDAAQCGFSALYRIYRCGDGQWLCLAVVTDAHWRALCSVVPGLDTDTRFADASARATHEDSLRVLLEAYFAERGANACFAVLDESGVPCEISSATFSRTLFDDAELHQRGWILRCEGHPDLGDIDMFGLGIDFSRTPGRVPRGPSPMWTHTREVLAEAGYDVQQIERWIADGVVLVPH